MFQRSRRTQLTWDLVEFSAIKRPSIDGNARARGRIRNPQSFPDASRSAILFLESRLLGKPRSADLAGERFSPLPHIYLSFSDAAPRGQCGLAFRPLTISFRSAVVCALDRYSRRRWNFAGTYSAYVPAKLPRDIPGYYPIFNAKLLSLSIRHRGERSIRTNAPVK